MMWVVGDVAKAILFAWIRAGVHVCRGEERTRFAVFITLFFTHRRGVFKCSVDEYVRFMVQLFAPGALPEYKSCVYVRSIHPSQRAITIRHFPVQGSTCGRVCAGGVTM